jgi:hypothetical protein
MFLAAGAGLLALLDAIWVISVAAGADAPPLLQAAGWPAALLVLAAASLWRVPPVSVSSAGWARVGVAAASAALCLPVVLLSQPGNPHNVLAGAALALVVVRFTISLLTTRSSRTPTP